MNEMIVRWPERNPRLFLAVAALVWFGCMTLIPVSGLWSQRFRLIATATWEVPYSFYDTPKVLMLLAIVFLMGMINSHFTPERTRAMLAGRSRGTANVDMAATLGVFYPVLLVLGRSSV